MYWDKKSLEYHLETLSTTLTGDEWEYPLPNSLREEMFEEICNYDSIELRLEKLKSMLNKELITEEEYNTKKQKLIDEL